MDSPENRPGPSPGPVGDDLSALAWVHGELRRSLENAHKALRRYLKEAESIGASDVDTVDPAVLRGARAQIHQGVGALELVGLPAVATALRAGESALQRMISRPALVNVAAIETVERVSFAVLDFLGRQLVGKPFSPVALFPQYRAAQQLAAADRVHPADLWPLDFQWHDLMPEPDVDARASDDAAREVMEGLVLSLMRGGDAAALAQMSDLCAELAAGAAGGHVATLWQIAAAVFEAQSHGLLKADLYSKRLASRLLAQLRLAVRGQHVVSDRLAQDLLFFCAHARHEPSAARLDRVRRTWRLDAHPTADYEAARLGRFDPAWIALARKRVAGAKEAWATVAGGELHRVASLAEPFALVGDSLRRLFPGGDVLAEALHAAAVRTAAAGEAPPPPLAMEVATSLLYLEASIEDGELDHPELAGRMLRLAARIDEARAGTAAAPLEPWMEELYRRVSDRQTMGSVVQELRATLSEVEKQIDQYFRNPAERQVLIPVPNQLSAMRGVLSVLGLEQASQAVLHMRDDIDALAQTEVDPERVAQTGTFDRVADNLGALSFLIDMLSVQPALAKSLFRFDPATGSLAAVMGQSERPSALVALDTEVPSPPSAQPAVGLPEQARKLIEQAADADVSDSEIERALERLAQQALAADQPLLARTAGGSLAALRGAEAPAQRQRIRADLGVALESFATAPAAPPPSVPTAPPRMTPAAAPGGTGLEDDAEMREIFIEEAREVVTEARAALERLVDAPDDAGEMTAVRRAFHTLKGSARMVGLRDFGEAGWACEQLYNARLAQAPRLDSPLRQFTAEALAYLGDWVEAIAARRDAGHRSDVVTRAADALRLEGRRLPIAAAGPPAVEPVAPPIELEFPQPQPEPASVLATEAIAAADKVEPPAPLPTPDSVVELEDDSELLSAFGMLPAAEAESVPAAATAAEIGETTAPPIGRELEPLVELPPERAADAAAVVDARSGGPAEERVSAPGAPAFDFDLDLGEAPFGTPPMPATSELMQLVPDLPAAADLELPPPAAVEPLASTVDLGPPSEVSFDLDLAQLEDEGPTPAPSALPVEPLAAALAGPLPDLAEFDLPASPDMERPAGQPEAPETGEERMPSAPAEVTGFLDEAEQVKVIGPLRIPIPLFNIFLNEADELSRRLAIELAEWGVAPQQHPVPESSVAHAHSLAGNSATVGYTGLSALARALEHALERSRSLGVGREGEAELFGDAADEIRRLLHQFAAGFLRPVPEELMLRLADHERWPAEIARPAEVPLAVEEPAEVPEAPPAVPAVSSVALPEFAPAEPMTATGVHARPDAFDDDQDIDAVDRIDGELFPIFADEAIELLPRLQSQLRAWLDHPGDREASGSCMRTLHTFKGGARLAGAMRLGEMAHRLETAIEHLAAQEPVDPAAIEALLARGDTMASAFEALRQVTAAPTPEAAVSPPEPAQTSGAALPAPAAEPETVAERGAQPVAALGAPGGATAAAAPVPRVAIDWQRFAVDQPAEPEALERLPAGGGAAVRVRAGLLDRLVNQAGEVSITRERIAADVKQLQGSLGELTDSLERMRRQLRDIELQAETQIVSRMETARAAGESFDPLEMDRFTRFQELTRFMAESVNDVATLQRSLQRSLQSTEDELAAQARLTRELQDDLLRTRMVEFESLADRLYRTVRQAAKETGKQVRLDIVGGAIEVDRGVLERMIGPFEHLLRNSVVHGIEAPERRRAAGKEAGGHIQIQVVQSGNEVSVELADDGAGFDYERIRRRALERGLLAGDAEVGDAELAQLLFSPGFSTADEVTELAGRGVGLDVVRAEVNAMGGRIETSSIAGQGTRFRLLLPLTTAVTQVVMLRCGTLTVAVPSTLIEVVRRLSGAELERAYSSGAIDHAGEVVPFYWLAALLQAGTRGETGTRTQAVVVIRSAAQRVAVHVDEVLGNQEVVVKNVGPQLSRLPGLAGVTLLPSGAVALIYNPVALATLYADSARALMRQIAPTAPAAEVPLPVDRAPLVLVVDDSLTVRRVTQRLLVREGYRVVTAKDGLEALERLAEERPAVLLSDIEMPRMDGFDLVRNVRADERLADLPVVMITSRIAQKHRDYASELGVDHYLGKPYSEEELLSLVARYCGTDIPS